MNKFRGMQLFSRVVSLGSFVAVAEETGTTASMVSKEIKKLEQEIGARLLHRSTRNIQLTPIGEGYVSRCREILSQVNESDAYIQQMQQSMTGRLRINLPMVLGVTDLGQVFADYMQQFPEVELDIHLDDGSLDLVEHGFDLGFRVSSQPVDSSYTGRPLKQFSYHVCAAPAYWAKAGMVFSPVDLLTHNCFEFSYFKGGKEWPLGGGVKIKGNLKVNNTLFMRDAIEAGLGVGFLPGFVAEPGLKSGKLQEVLAEVEKPALTLYALYLNRKFTPPILLKCIEFIEQWFAKT